MASAREIITLQFGHYSNFVGTQLWNLQESAFCYEANGSKSTEVNNDCLFREGRTLDGGETYTPRLLLYDLKGCLRNLSVEGALYSSASRAVEWRGELSVHQAGIEPKNEFQMDMEEDEESVERPCQSDHSDESVKAPIEQCEPLSARNKLYDLDDQVSVWSDFVGTSYHPKSVNIIKEYLHEADHFAFDVFGYGQSLYMDRDFRDEFENSLHFFVEECDQFQGFQVLTDIHNGFAGLSSQVIEDLADEYSSKSVITFGFLPATFPGNTNIKSACRLLNMALSFDKLASNSSIFTPLSLARQGWFNTGSPASFPHLSYKADLAYHTSAVLASTIDTVTLPYRLSTSLRCRMDDLASSLTFGGRKITSASTSFPFPIGSRRTLSTVLNSSLHSKDYNLCVPLTPNVNQVNQMISHMAVLRGTFPTVAHNMEKTTQPLKKPKTLIDSCQSSSDILNVFSQGCNPMSVCKNWVTEQACAVTPPFPNIFSPSVTKDGMVEENSSRDPKSIVEQVNVLANLGTSKAVGEMLQSLVNWAKKVDIRKYNSFLESGIEYETFLTVLEDLTSLAQNYENP